MFSVLLEWLFIIFALKFHLGVKTRVIRVWVKEGPNARDLSAFFAFHSSLVEVHA